MARVSTYLNFMGTTEEAFTFYAGVFGTEVEGLMRLGDTPPDPNGQTRSDAKLSDAELRLVMHAQLPILGGHMLMATDMVESMGHELRVGNNITIELEPDTREETDRLYAALSEGGTDCSGMQEMFWGYWGTCLDRYGVRWMFNYASQPPA